MNGVEDRRQAAREEVERLRLERKAEREEAAERSRRLGAKRNRDRQKGRTIAARKTCEQKTPYLTITDALETAAQFDHPLYPYRCPVCGKWHLTKKKKDDRTYMTVAEILGQGEGQ